MRQVIACLLVLVIVGRFPLACHGQTPVQPNSDPPAGSIARQVSQIPIGAFIEVRFTDKKKSRGHLSKVESDGFSFNTGKAASGTLRQAAFNDVKSIRVVQPTHTPVAAWIVAAVIGTAVVLAVAVVVIERHNE